MQTDRWMGGGGYGCGAAGASHDPGTDTGNSGELYWKAGVRFCLFLALAVSSLFAADHRGEVLFHGTPVPGATVVMMRDGKKRVASTDALGRYAFPDLAEGAWQIEIEMFGFASVKRDLIIRSAATAIQWELTMLALSEIQAVPHSAPASQAAKEVAAPDEKPPAEAARPKRSGVQAASQPPEAAPQNGDDQPKDFSEDGLLINGSVNNGGDSPFAQSAAFGNARHRKGYSLYNGGIGLMVGNSALDARPFSLTGGNAFKPSYNRTTGSLNFGGPLPLKRLLRQDAYFLLSYERSRRSDSTIQAALMPTTTERNGVFSQAILDPASGTLFAGNTIPDYRISPQAKALLRFYPIPASDSSRGYNHQIPLLTSTHEDSLKTRVNRYGVNTVNVRFELQSSRAATPNLFAFQDTMRAREIETGVKWSRNITRAWAFTLGYSFSRQTRRLTPYFAARENVSGEAGIEGNSQESRNWGPPSLGFFSGIAGLSAGQSSLDGNQTSQVAYSMNWHRLAHQVTFGIDISRKQFNNLGDQNARGSFTFSGRYTGNDLADFLLGVPDTASLTLGNADKHFRQMAYAAFLQDDWKVSPALSLKAGVRWEYATPVTELNDRLANLDIAPDFAAAAPVLADNPVGSLTARRYGRALVDADLRAIQPRVAIAWRPLTSSSLVVRSGYGVYYDKPVYQTIALQMAQQPPLSTTLSMQNSSSNPWSMRNAFLAATSSSNSTFAIDPHFRMGSAQNWNASVQTDLPAALQMTATYLGVKGTHGFQEFLPNTNPLGATRTCPSCPVGFVYLTSGANSSRQAGALQLRRRMRSGLTATAQYTFSKSIDDASALGAQGVSGLLKVAQDWRHLKGERSLSSFDQRHLFHFQMQYTTGMGVAGGMLRHGWIGTLIKQWTVAPQLTAGSGLPQTPVYMAAVPGTGITGTIRPDYTGAAIQAAPAGFYLNPAAFRAPQPGAWGTAGRNSITGPGQFALNSSLGRDFRLQDKYNLTFRADVTNLLNHVTYTAWNIGINSSQFGLPAAPNAMRAVQTTLRLRF